MRQKAHSFASLEAVLGIDAHFVSCTKTFDSKQNPLRMSKMM